jgi:dTDP-4-dehydrorhamnose reductase
VYSGRTGNYNESSTHDCLDAYGKSKSLGEPDNCMVLRTSIIGEEIHKKISLIEWAKSQKGKTVSGFTNHLWNGITTQQYAIICQKIIEQNLYSKELYHVFSNHITKYDLLKLFNKRFDLDLNIEKKESEEIIDRTLSSLKDLNTKLMIPSIQDQISSM